MSNLLRTLLEQFPELPFEDAKPLAPLTYLKVGGPAEVYVSLSDKNGFINLIKFCQTEHIKYTLLGGASNVIVSDEGISGLVIQYTSDLIEDRGDILGTDSSKHLISAASGIKMALLVAKTVQLGYTGLEYFLGVPGTLGGATYNNSHYLSQLIGTYINRVEVISNTGDIIWLTNEECEFGYDSSRFHRTKEVILTIEFALQTGTKESSQEKIKEATMYRAQTQPLGPPSSGCIFQNVPNTTELKELFPQFANKPYVPGGFIIDQAGLKGTTVGGVEVSQKHAAWFINTGSATAQDVRNLVSLVKARVRERFGVQLREEVFYIE